jgi:hypothetical protein
VTTHYNKLTFRHQATTANAAVTSGRSQVQRLVTSADTFPAPGYTPFSHTVMNSDGSYTVQRYGAPEFHLTPGGWQAIDLSITPDGSGGLSVPNAFVPLSFGNTSSDLVSLNLPGGTISVGAPGLHITSPAASGQTVTFSNVATQVTPASLERHGNSVVAAGACAHVPAPKPPHGRKGGLRSAETAPGKLETRPSCRSERVQTRPQRTAHVSKWPSPHRGEHASESCRAQVNGSGSQLRFQR